MSDYKRITRRNEDGTTWVKCVCCENVATCDYTKESCCQVLQDRLAELEDKIENGTLIELPCKKGDTVYYIDKYWQSPRIEEFEVSGFVMNNKNELLILVAYGIFCMSQDEIFLTKAEAEAELAKIRGQKQ